MISKRNLSLAAVMLLALTACGSNTADRMVTGAGIGAATGATIGWLTGIGPGVGAAIGAGVGGAVGAVTDSSDVDLGTPWWR